MKIAITGHEGNVGSEILRQRPEVIPLLCDITKENQVERELGLIAPNVIIHCAALTDIDECEENDMKAFSVNVGGVKNIVNWFTRGTFCYLSSDHVFDGNKYYAYSEKHKPNPINIYGRTKHMGEAMANFGSHRSVIVRASKMFTYDDIKADLECLSSGMSVDFTDRIYRSFVHVEHFVDGLLSLIDKIGNKEVVITKKDNIINIAGSDKYSYYTFWTMIAREFHIPMERVIKRDYTLEEKGIDISPRPFRCGLDISKATKLGIPIYSAYDGIRLIRERNIDASNNIG